ncbi:lipopolysaccharide biosynthesis protein [Pontibacter pamirensis]|uniref:lipopolysaccharide biosynthesis protein n=1 Tax=Pontibacter pamirensis TaxID=2562824 RepID=UPI00138A506E|nr:lipopolysaccharide biosynthesis protein [Pontibacter pamirensis]
MKGGFSTIAGQVFSFVINISSTIILARLLTPDDYGLVAMVTAVTGFITIFNDLGLSSAVIQKENINQQQVSAVFWINVIISLGIAIIVALLAPFLVHFYDEERLFYMTIVFSVGIFISGLSLQHSALLKRQMKFQNLALIQAINSFLSILCGVLLAWFGFGYWAIVAIMVLFPSFNTLAFWIACDWRPSFTFKAYNVKSFVKFGAGITGFDLINYFSRNMDNVLIGKYIGSVALGLYTKAYQLLLLPITQLRNPLNSVALPALSTLQNDREKYKSYYKRFLFILAFFSMPAVVFMAVFSEELILIVLGDQWIAASSIFQILALAAFIQPTLGTIGLVMITTGDTKRYFIWGCINAVLVVTAFFIGVQWGVDGVAKAYVAVTYLLLFPSLYYSLQGSPVPVPLFLKEISLPALFSITCGVAMYFFRYYFESLHEIILCASGFFIGAVLYLLLWFTSRASRERAKQVLEIRHVLTNKFK